MGQDSCDEANRLRYDVDLFRKTLLENVKKRGRLSRFFGRIAFSLDSVQGLLVGLLSTLIIFGTIGMVAAGFYLGPLGFVGILVAIIGGLSFVVDRRAGKSLQFEDYGLVRKLVAETIALGLGMGILFFLIFGLPKLTAFHLF